MIMKRFVNINPDKKLVWYQYETVVNIFDNLKILKLIMPNGNVNVYSTERKNIEILVRYYSSDETKGIKINKISNILEICSLKSNVEAQIVLAIPRNLCNIEFQVLSENGNFDIDKFNVEKILLNNRNGIIKIKNTRLNMLDIVNNTGNIQIKKSTFENLKIVDKIGNITFTENSLNEGQFLSFEINSGNIDIYDNKIIDDKNLCVFAFAKNGMVKNNISINNEFFIEKNRKNTCYIKAKIENGNININF